MFWSIPAHAVQRPQTPEAYTRALAAKWYGWRGAEWEALQAIVRPESGWDPCARFPSTHDCSYAGSNSCGIPQADPCPEPWRGRLFGARWEQCRWLLWYVHRRYGDPLAALAYRRSHGSY